MIHRMKFRASGCCVIFCCTLMAFASCGRKKQADSSLFSDVDTTSFVKGDTVFPFSYLVPKEKGWKVVIEISGDDYENGENAKKGRRYSTTKPQVLKLIKDWQFVYTGGDLATVTSSILVYRDGTLVDQQGIVLSKNAVGLQSIKYGWIEPLRQRDVYRSLELMEEKFF
jgi:hypothetical protein